MDNVQAFSILPGKDIGLYAFSYTLLKLNMLNYLKASLVPWLSPSQKRSAKRITYFPGSITARLSRPEYHHSGKIRCFLVLPLVSLFKLFVRMSTDYTTKPFNKLPHTNGTRHTHETQFWNCTGLYMYSLIRFV